MSPDPRPTPGELVQSAACYLAAAEAVRTALVWAHEGGPRMADSFEGGARRAEILADLEQVKADPLGYHYGRDADGRLNAPTGCPNDDQWDPADTVIGNLVKARDLTQAAIGRIQEAERG